MDPSRFDTITKLFARRRMTRRQALTGVGAGLAAGALGIAATAQEATPVDAASDELITTSTLFVQSFRSGSITPSDDVDGRYTVTLDHGLGQTIYFSDRPQRIVGSTPTDTFLAGVGFSPTNPPNAAILTDNGEGETTLAVVELFDPAYDKDSATVTYEMAILEHWHDATDLDFTATPIELDAVGASFGTAHLFIDDCSAFTRCVGNCDPTFGVCEDFGPIPDGPYQACWSTYYGVCMPCYDDPQKLTDLCNQTYPDCDGGCEPMA